MNRQCYLTGFLHRMARVAQVVEGDVDVRVVDRPLEDLAIHLEDGGPGRFGLPHHVTDRLLDQIALYGAVESHQHAQLPVRTGVTGFLRQPNV